MFKMFKRKKIKFILLPIFLFSIFLPDFVNAASLLDGITGGNLTKDSILRLISNVRVIILGIAAALAVLFILIGGIMYITSAGNKDQADQGKKYLTYAVGGLILIIFAEVIIRIFATILGGSYK